LCNPRSFNIIGRAHTSSVHATHDARSVRAPAGAAAAAAAVDEGRSRGSEDLDLDDIGALLYSPHDDVSAAGTAEGA